MSCETCPFAYTEASEMVQNYGCLPTRYDIVQMKKETNQNWGCHSEEKVTVCRGFVRHVAEVKAGMWNENDLDDIDTKSGGVISYDDWHNVGAEEACRLAKEREDNRG